MTSILSFRKLFPKAYTPAQKRMDRRKMATWDTRTLEHKRDGLMQSIAMQLDAMELIEAELERRKEANASTP